MVQRSEQMRVFLLVEHLGRNIMADVSLRYSFKQEVIYLIVRFDGATEFVQCC